MLPTLPVELTALHEPWKDNKQKKEKMITCPEGMSRCPLSIEQVLVMEFERR
jgi:hypothetical protein